MKTPEGYLVPIGTESDGFMIDGMVLVKPGDDGYDEWDAFYKLSIGEDEEADDEPVDFEDDDEEDEDDVEF